MSESPIPYVHGRDLLPIRRQRRRPDARLQRLLEAEAHIRQEINDLDEVVVEASRRRRRLLEELGSLIDQIRPSCVGARGRRRRAVSHEEALPPTAKRPKLLSGRELRAVCLAFLRKAGSALTLRQLHALLHRAGYAIAHHHPVKALADALGHETDQGRAKRTARATYAAVTSGDAPEVSTIPDF
jgi:hypothetical protein